MSELTAPVPPWRARLDGWRAQGADRLDPVRFRYLEALGTRMDTAAPGVRRLLSERLERALAEHERRLQQTQNSLAEQATRLQQAHPPQARALRAMLQEGDAVGLRRLAILLQTPATTALAKLNGHLRTTERAGDGGSTGTALAPAPAQGGGEMRSLRRFRQVWTKVAAQDKVQRALQREPRNAGPLNSHMLVLRTIELMRDLSPDYLARFVTQLDTLLWLEQASPPRAMASAAAAKAERKPRARKPRA